MALRLTEMKVAVFGSKPYDRESLTKANEDHGQELVFIRPRLSPETAELARGCDAVCTFVNDDCGPESLERLHELGVRIVALRCAGFDRVDIETARRLGMTVVRVPSYSPHAIAEHALALVLALNRKIYRSYNRVREGNFSLNGLLGWDLYGKTVGLVGTGNIGYWAAKAFHGLGCEVIAHDLRPNEKVRELGVDFVSLEELLNRSKVVSLHVPLVASTYHLMNAERIALMRHDALLINTSRGGLLDTTAAIDALRHHRLGGLGIDVFEGEGNLFFEDRSLSTHVDLDLSVLMALPNVIVTAHQAFFTEEALANIGDVTLTNLDQLERGETCANALC
ncbi:MAG: 2-hydroxyacid dehydrogenase [Candidatus Nanopelagicales bacterium]|nr:2-hydroxyacid dehydrogenase [Candidatus Nanopelagicales bacterium]